VSIITVTFRTLFLAFFLSDYIYAPNKGLGGKDSPLELLLEILDASKTYKVADLFDKVQGEIVERRLVTPDSVDKSEFVSFP
jgi:hypothetical protein